MGRPIFVVRERGREGRYFAGMVREEDGGWQPLFRFEGKPAVRFASKWSANRFARALAARVVRLRPVGKASARSALEARLREILERLPEGAEVTTRQLAAELGLPSETEDGYRAASITLGCLLRRAGWERAGRRRGAGGEGRSQRVYRRRPAEGAGGAVAGGEGVGG